MKCAHSYPQHFIPAADTGQPRRLPDSVWKCGSDGSCSAGNPDNSDKYQLLQPGRFNQFRERIKDPVGRGQVLDTGVWILKAEAGHAGCPGRCASVAGIFYDKAFPRISMQAPGGFEKNVGRRFGVWDAFAAEEDVEILADGELLHAELDVLLGRRRRDRQMKALTVQKRDRLGDSVDPGNPIGRDDFIFNFTEPFHDGRIAPEIPSVSLIDETAEVLACGADTALVAVVLQ